MHVQRRRVRVVVLIVFVCLPHLPAFAQAGSAGNRVDPTVIPPLSPAFSGNTGGSSVGPDHPWANFSY